MGEYGLLITDGAGREFFERYEDRCGAQGAAESYAAEGYKVAMFEAVETFEAETQEYGVTAGIDYPRTLERK